METPRLPIVKSTTGKNKVQLFKEWFFILLGNLKNLGDESVRTFLHWWVISPGYAIAYLILYTAAAFVPGTAISTSLKTQADDVYEKIQSSQFGVESLALRWIRLRNKFFEHAKLGLIHEKDHKLYQTLLRLNHHDAFDRVEIMLKYPRSFKTISAGVEGKALKEVLEKSTYKPKLCREIYERIAAYFTARKYKIPYIAQGVYIQGEPGTGKTRLIQKIAQALNLPYFKVPLGEGKCYDRGGSFFQQLYGVAPGYYASDVGSFARFVGTPTDWEGKELEGELCFPILRHFDEIEKVRDVSIRSFLREEMNNGEEVLRPAEGLGGLVVSNRSFIDFFTANGPLMCYDHEAPLPGHAASENSKDVDKSLMDRMIVMDAESYNREEKRIIMKSLVEQLILEHVALEPITEVEEIQILNANIDVPGVRQMKSQICERMLLRLAIKDGWEVSFD